jgi:hypothetical protein
VVIVIIWLGLVFLGDFGREKSKHEGCPKMEDVTQMIEQERLRAMGLVEWDSSAGGLSGGQREALDRAKKELGFYM